MMTRRAFLWGALLAMLAAPLAAEAQAPARIAWIWPGSTASSAAYLSAFKEGMRENGLVEGKDFVIEQRYGEGLLPDSLLYDQRDRIAAFVLKNRIPTFVQQSEMVASGSLISYGTQRRDLYRRAATYVKRILAGAKPADLPVEQPTKFELVINLKTAKALGLTIPPSLLGRADQVIE
jgi:ABC transporter substrate binding protein